MGAGRQLWGAPPTSGEADAAKQGPKCPGAWAGASRAPGLTLTALPKFKPAAAAHSPGPADGPLPPAGRRPPLPLASLGAPPAPPTQGHRAVPSPGLAHKVPPHAAAGSVPQGPSCLRSLSRPQMGTVGGGRRGAGSELSHDPAAALDLHLPRSAASSPADALPLHGTPQSKGLAAEAPGPPWGRGAWPGGAQQHPPLARDPSLSRLAWNGLPVISLGRFPLWSSRVLEDERSWPEKAPGGLGAACLRGNVPRFPSAPSEGQSRPAQRAWPRSQHPTGLSQWALPSGGPCVPAGMISCIRGPAATPCCHPPAPGPLAPTRAEGTGPDRSPACQEPLFIYKPRTQTQRQPQIHSLLPARLVTPFIQGEAGS